MGENFLPHFFDFMMHDNKTAKLDEVDSLLKQRNYREAIVLLEDIHKRFPDDESALLRLAWAFWDNGNKEQSIEYWEILLDRELQRNVFTGFAFDELVRISKQEGQIEKLVTICEKAINVQPLDIGLLEELGKAYLLSGQSEKACETFKKLTSMEKDNPAFFCRLGEALMAAGKTEASEDAYRQAGLMDPDGADRYFFQAADLYLKNGHPEKAEEMLMKCLAITPTNSLYRCSLGDVFIALKKIEEAFAAYEKASQYNRPHAASYYNRLGNSLMKSEWFADAVKAFETALTFDASTPCRKNLEQAYQASGRSPLHSTEKR